MKHPDYIDNATDLSETLREKELAAHLARVKEIRRTEPAQNIVEGHVLCIGCGEQVHTERLRIKPHAARCTECEKIIEEYGHRG